MSKTFSWCVIALLLLVAAAFGQDATPAVPAVPEPDSLGALLVGFLAVGLPIAIRYVKKRAENIPAHWLPTIGPIVGAFASIALYYGDTGLPGVNGLTAIVAGLLLGAAGTGARELVDQWMKRFKDGVRSAK